MKLDLNFLIVGLDGKAMEGHFENIHVGAIVANALAYQPIPIESLTPMRRILLAQELYKKNPVEVDKSEAKGIKNLICVENGFPPITVNLVHEEINKILE